jgi:hypothetical protein
MTVWFRYSFVCPLCRKIISSGDEMEFAPSRDDIPATVYGKHPTCPRCHKPLPTDRIDLWITEIRKQ